MTTGLRLDQYIYKKTKTVQHLMLDEALNKKFVDSPRATVKQVPNLMDQLVFSHSSINDIRTCCIKKYVLKLLLIVCKGHNVS